MRPIDADALFQPDENSDKILIVAGRSSGKLLAMATELLKQKVNNAPTLEVEPVRHGRWEEKQMWQWIYAYCPYCNTTHNTKTNYCPNCGVKMDKKED